MWTRADRGSRKPRFNRDDIAAAAIRIADTEGFEAVSMRRLAAELDAGTMSLYHYVRTKDELLDARRRRSDGRGRAPDGSANATRLACGDHPHRQAVARRACGVTRGSSTSPTTPTSGRTRCVTSTSRGKRLPR